MIVIGSTALKHHGFDVTPKDLDLVGTYDEAMNFKRKFGAVSYYPINNGESMYMRNVRGDVCEIELAWEGSRAWKLIEFMQEQAKHAWCDIIDIHGYGCHLPTKELLYMLKMSHRYLKDSPHHFKTHKDIIELRNMDVRIPKSWGAFLKERESLTYLNKLPNLNVKASSFFDVRNTGVVQQFLHDDIHVAVAVEEVPAYTRFLTGEVKCDEGLFNNLSQHRKIYAGLEESIVLALERSIVPFPGKKTHEEAFMLALAKVTSSITSGWFREWCWWNINEIRTAYAEHGESMIGRFWKGVSKGSVRLKLE